MYLLALFVELLAIYFAINKARKAIARRIKPKKAGLQQATKNRNIETIKATKQAEKAQIKAIEQNEKQRQKQEQAQADILFYQSQLDKITEMLFNSDNELQEIESQIKINNAMRSYDKNKKEIKRKEQVIKKIITLENKVHTIESKIAKSQYILQAV